MAKEDFVSFILFSEVLAVPSFSWVLFKQRKGNERTGVKGTGGTHEPPWIQTCTLHPLHLSLRDSLVRPALQSPVLNHSGWRDIKEARWKGLWGNSYNPGEAPLPLLCLYPTLYIDSCREARCPGELSCHAVVCHSRHIIDQAKSFPCLTGRGGGEMSSWHESLGKQVSTDTRQFIFLDSSHFLPKKK